MNASPVILAMDTSLGGCSVAIWQDNRITANLHESQSGQQSRKLLMMIEKALESCKLTYQDLDAVACTIGPGGFTGIRTGLTAARAIRLAANKPLIGLTTLEVMAHASILNGDILVAIDAYRGQYYVQRFRKIEKLQPLSTPLLVDEKLVSALAHGAKIERTPPDAAQTASLASEKWQNGERDFPDAPLYIREPDAKLPSTPA